MTESAPRRESAHHRAAAAASWSFTIRQNVRTASVYGLAFAVWQTHEPAATLGDWAARSGAYVPGAAVVLIALLLPAASGIPPETEP